MIVGVRQVGKSTLVKLELMKGIFGRNFIPPMLPLIWKEISMN
ncbi:hypothetical protein HMPREF1145_1668 [Oribacterium parvum ACB8]|nr:hypothetical protein HMPREF1145_1668 [Oribacterium parvum ACB8]